MGEHTLHSLILAADYRVDDIELDVVVDQRRGNRIWPICPRTTWWFIPPFGNRDASW